MNLEALQYPIGRMSEQESYSFSDTQQHIESIESLPLRLLNTLAQLSDEQMAQPYREGGWTGNQVVHHMADSHLNCLIRVKLTLTEDTPTVKPYHEERWAQLPDYDLPLDSAIDMIRSVHFKLSHLLKSLTEEELRRTYHHPQYNYTRDISYLAALYAWHGNHHVGHLKLLMK